MYIYIYSGNFHDVKRAYARLARYESSPSRAEESSVEKSSDLPAPRGSSTLYTARPQGQTMHC